MRIGIHGKSVTADNKYHVRHGTTKSQYNKTAKKFNKRAPATKYKNSLVKKYSKSHKIDYSYLAD